ncbi:hypothetical protein U9M48_007049 [Paspalum notatum var. saurae]|uniref:Uncharacterized protein n=1 Tax=Paspalum notatum var. saurae TaxID=547442 RepID=A0AAQ3SKX6_PASNO
MHFTPCTHLHNDIHIDHGIEERTTGAATDRGARGPGTVPARRGSPSWPAADSAPDDTNPSEEGMEFLFRNRVGGELTRYHRE